MGMLAVGLLASPEVSMRYEFRSAPETGLFYNGDWGRFVTQSVAAAAIIGFVLTSRAVARAVLHAAGLLRVSLQEEEEGSDLATHGEEAYGKGGEW